MTFDCGEDPDGSKVPLSDKCREENWSAVVVWISGYVLYLFMSVIHRTAHLTDTGNGLEPVGLRLSCGNTTPVLMINGNKDPLCSLASAKDTFRVGNLVTQIGALHC